MSSVNKSTLKSAPIEKKDNNYSSCDMKSCYCLVSVSFTPHISKIPVYKGRFKLIIPHSYSYLISISKSDVCLSIFIVIKINKKKLHDTKHVQYLKSLISINSLQ